MSECQSSSAVSLVVQGILGAVKILKIHVLGSQPPKDIDKKVALTNMGVAEAEARVG